MLLSNHKGFKLGILLFVLLIILYVIWAYKEYRYEQGIKTPEGKARQEQRMEEEFNKIMTPENIDKRCKNIAEDFYKKYNDPKDRTYTECMKDYEAKPQ